MPTRSRPLSRSECDSASKTPNVSSANVWLTIPEISGVTFDFSELVSLIAFAFANALKPSKSNGFAVFILMVAPIPPEATFALPVL